MKLYLAPLLLALISVPALAQSQKVYRCGNTYSQQPCPGGSAIDADDRRTPEQRRAHEASVQHERRTADTLEKNRLKEEEAAARAAQKAEKAAAEHKPRAASDKPARYFTARNAAGDKKPVKKQNAGKDAAR